MRLSVSQFLHWMKAIINTKLLDYLSHTYQWHLGIKSFCFCIPDAHIHSFWAIIKLMLVVEDVFSLKYSSENWLCPWSMKTTWWDNRQFRVSSVEYRNVWNNQQSFCISLLDDVNRVQREIVVCLIEIEKSNQLKKEIKL